MHTSVSARPQCNQPVSRRHRCHNDVQHDFSKQSSSPCVVWMSALAVLSGTGMLMTTFRANSLLLKALLALTFTCNSRRVQDQSCKQLQALQSHDQPCTDQHVFLCRKVFADCMSHAQLHYASLEYAAQTSLACCIDHAQRSCLIASTQDSSYYLTVSAADVSINNTCDLG